MNSNNFKDFSAKLFSNSSPATSDCLVAIQRFYLTYCISVFQGKSNNLLKFKNKCGYLFCHHTKTEL